jgi:hypothetical protein
MPTAAVDARFRGQNGHERADLSPALAGLVFETAISAAELLLGEFPAFRLAAGAAHRVNVHSLSDTFAGIAPAGVVAFIAAQLAGMLAAVGVSRWLWRGRRPHCR